MKEEQSTQPPEIPTTAERVPEPSRTYTEKQEKEEKNRRDPLGTISSAAFLIWAGVVLLLNNLGQIRMLTSVLDQLNVPEMWFPVNLPFVDPRVWQAFFLGWAVILLAEALVRTIVPVYRWNVVGNLFWAGILLGITLGKWAIIGPGVLIAIGIAVLIQGFIRG
ncbi:MAG: hypothetical protein P1P76_00845 [Anaerolineales bacterium]|nr:hypothetical protein [Anaerolineales bacterium]